ncbi:hypothetical protein EII34_14695 [Arachnia propionica]|uniref:Uncharacterized protein n=1 Tax=Arachnia propionica TaxID=1750 RepID=A0A3P1T1R9_9ACTN|nr:hypothetical protein [Arachnia propionica]RRD03309.1 hypothetical protein EII34_14695 [Arachnia propionica]
MTLLARSLTTPDVHERATLVAHLARHGSPDDARRALAAFLTAPSSETATLLPIVVAHGGQVEAEQLMAHVVASGLHTPDEPDDLLAQPIDDVLAALAEMRHEPVKAILAREVFTPAHGARWSLNQAAAHGLLHFDCAEYQQQIVAAIQACHGRNIFDEATPVLVARLTDPDLQARILADLYELGTTTASVDCNSGILRGFALSGAAGRPWFLKALLNPAWECDAGGTGTDHHAYEGLHEAGITFAELRHLVRAQPDENRAHAVNILVMLLAKRIHDTRPHAETCTELYRMFFADDDGETLDDGDGHTHDLQQMLLTRLALELEENA